MKKSQKYYSFSIISFLLILIFLQAPYLSGQNFYLDSSQFVDLSRPPDWIQGYTLVLLDCNDIESTNKARDYIIEMGGTIAILAPPYAMVGWIPPEIADELVGNYGIESIHFNQVDIAVTKFLDKEMISLVKFFNYVTSGELEQDFYVLRRKGSPLINDALRPPPINFNNYFKNLSQKSIDTRIPIPHLKPEEIFSPGNSDSMVGTVACCLFFVESDGSIDANSYTWTSSALSHTYNQCASGLSWWASKASSRGISLSFSLYHYPPENSYMNQGYEPIFHSSNDDYLWINAIMSNMGNTSGSKRDRVAAFNSWLKGWAGTNWGFSAFFAYNPPDQGAPSRFTNDRFAYAYYGGPYTQMLYKNNGWSLNDIGSILAHETGHIFWACDEYSEGCTSCYPCNSYRPVENGNCEHPNCNPYNSVPCIMRHNANAVCSYTEQQVGWFTSEPKEAHIELDQDSLSFTGSEGEANPPSQTFSIRNSGTGDMNYQLNVSHSWISVYPSSGSSSGEWNEISVTVYTTGMGRGSYTGTVSVASGEADNSPQNLTVRLTILEDRPPTVSITSPQNGEIVSGTVIVKADATDDKGVTKVEFYLDNILNSTDYNAPFEWSWSSNTASLGYHTLKAKAYDTINQTAENSVQVEIVDRAPEVSITSPKDGATVSKTITIRANATDDKGVTKVEFYVDNKFIGVDQNSPYSISWDTTKYSSGFHTIKARAYDTINQTGDDSIQVKVDQPPEVTISSPTDGANVSGIVTIKANATDDFGIKKVQFYIDGELQRTDSKHPYEYNWNTTQILNGSYRIRTTVYDTINQTDTDLIAVELIPHAPVDFSGDKVENRALLQREFINVLNWKSNPYNNNIEKYRIYLIEGSSSSLIAELNADTFEYWHRNVNKDEQYQYALVAVDNQGREGNPALLTVQ